MGNERNAFNLASLSRSTAKRMCAAERQVELTPVLEVGDVRSSFILWKWNTVYPDRHVSDLGEDTGRELIRWDVRAALVAPDVFALSAPCVLPPWRDAP